MRHCARQALKCNLLFYTINRWQKRMQKLRCGQSEPVKLFLPLPFSPCESPRPLPHPRYCSSLSQPVGPLASPIHFHPTQSCPLHSQGTSFTHLPWVISFPPLHVNQTALSPLLTTTEHGASLVCSGCLNLFKPQSPHLWNEYTHRHTRKTT